MWLQGQSGLSQCRAKDFWAVVTYCPGKANEAGTYGSLGKYLFLPLGGTRGLHLERLIVDHLGGDARELAGRRKGRPTLRVPAYGETMGLARYLRSMGWKADWYEDFPLKGRL